VRCPFCNADDTRVIESRVVEDGEAIRRRRECASCARRFTTFERYARVMTMVVKRTGALEEFDREKIVRGMRAALKNRPVSSMDVDRVVSELEEQLRPLSEVTSTEIGLQILEHLRTLDEVGYLRFASVYKNFDGVDDFRREVSEIDDRSFTLRKKEDEGGPV
jgi:transcriptional repressor NrdR